MIIAVNTGIPFQTVSISNFVSKVVRLSPEQKKHMWQSRIEIEYYSVMYFERITKFDVL